MMDTPEFSDTCRTCGGMIGWIDCPTGGWWHHDEHPADDHDAVPVGDENGCYTLPDGDCVGACSLHHFGSSLDIPENTAQGQS